MSITRIFGCQTLTYMAFFLIIVKIFTLNKILNIADKTKKLQNIPANRDFQKSRFYGGKIGFWSISPVLAYHTPLSYFHIRSYYSYPAHSNRYPTNNALHTKLPILGCLQEFPPRYLWIGVTPRLSRWSTPRAPYSPRRPRRIPQLPCPTAREAA